MAEFQKKQVQVALNNRFVCIMNPIGHSKTTVFSVSYPIWRLWKERDFEACVVASSLDQSKKIMNIVQSSIETNPFLKQLIPESRDTSWNKLETTTSNGNYYYVKPFNSSVRGVHPNLLVCDDILRETDTPMREIKDLFWSVIFGRVQSRKGQLIVVGTPQTQDDLFADIRKKSLEGSTWKFMKQTAVTMDERGNWLEPLWKERFTLDELKDIRDAMGPIRFSREYLCDPISSGASVYKKEDILACCDDTLGFSQVADISEGPVYIGCDFAMSTSASGDYSVFTVVQKINALFKRNKKTEEGVEYSEEINGAVVIKKIERYKGMNFDNQIDRIVTLAQMYSPEKIIVDASNFGTPFFQELQKRMIPVEGQMMPANVRNALLLNICKFIEKDRNGHRKLVIPSKEDSGYSISMRLIDELFSMQESETRANTTTIKSVADHDDCVMSLALALRDIQKSYGIAKHVVVTA